MFVYALAIVLVESGMPMSVDVLHMRMLSTVAQRGNLMQWLYSIVSLTWSERVNNEIVWDCSCFVIDHDLVVVEVRSDLARYRVKSLCK